MSERQLTSPRRFSRSRTPCLIGLVLCTGIFTYALYFVFGIGFEAASTEYSRGLLMYGVCVVALPFSGLASTLFARGILKRENGLIIDEAGVHDQLSFNGRIDWSNISGVQQLKQDSDSSAFVLKLKDRGSYLRRRWTKPFVARGQDEIMIYAMGLSSAAEILAAIETGIRTNRKQA